MTSDLIHDRGRGPEIVGTRITVYDLLPYFLDPTVTEVGLCQQYDLTAEQVAAARGYVLNHADTVLAQHLEIEAKRSPGNPPEVIARMERTRATLLSFKDWLAKQEKTGETGSDSSERNGQARLPTFREWVAARRSSSESGS